MLKKKLSKIDMGIITRHIVVALENGGKTVSAVKPVTNGKEFAVEIGYSNTAFLQ